MKLGALVSTGKDSLFAMYKASSDNEIKCLITVQSSNPDSYMFHTPSVELVKYQAEALGLPLVMTKTEGIKEKELEDLKKVIVEAKKKYGIQGVTTGALFSEYQKNRIEKICSALGLKAVSPLWHMYQEKYMRELIKSDFKFILTKIACYGLDESWLGKVITEKDVDKLVEINNKLGINIAFEGGEAESFVIDAPMFKSKIIIKKAEKIMENEYTGIYKILEVALK